MPIQLDQAVPADQAVPDKAVPDKAVPDLPILLDQGNPGALTILDPEPKPLKLVATGNTTDGKPVVAYGNGVYLVAAEVKGNLVGVVVNPNGTVNSSYFSIEAGTASAGHPDITFLGGNLFLVVWTEGKIIKGRRFFSNGAPGGAAFDISQESPTTQKAEPAVAYNGTIAMVTWLDSRNTTSDRDIYGALVKTTGALPFNYDIKITTANGYQEEVDVAGNQAGFFVVWEDRAKTPWSVQGIAVSEQGVLNSTSHITFSHSSIYTRFPSIATDGTNFMAVFSEGSNTMAARIKPNGTQVGSLLKTMYVPSQLHPDVAFNGKDYLVAVYGHDGSIPTDYNIYLARVTTGGVLLDNKPIVATSNTSAQKFPSVAGNDKDLQWLVVWEDLRNTVADTYGTRVK